MRKRNNRQTSLIHKFPVPMKTRSRFLQFLEKKPFLNINLYVVTRLAKQSPKADVPVIVFVAAGVIEDALELRVVVRFSRPVPSEDKGSGMAQLGQTGPRET